MWYGLGLTHICRPGPGGRRGCARASGNGVPTLLPGGTDTWAAAAWLAGTGARYLRCGGTWRVPW
jgi:hypothetical protein